MAQRKKRATASTGKSTARGKVRAGSKSARRKPAKKAMPKKRLAKLKPKHAGAKKVARRKGRPKSVEAQPPRDLRAAASSPAPQASAIITGLKHRSAAWRAVGSIPTCVAIPTTATDRIPQSRNASARGVPSNADMVILSSMASSGIGVSSETI